MNVEDFGDLTEAERGLIAHLRHGWPGVFCASDGVPPEYAMYNRHIRASLIRALVLGKTANCPLPEQGLRIWGAFIRSDGTEACETRGLDLEGVMLKHDLALFGCRFPDPLLLRNAHVANLYLNHSVLASGLNADGLKAKGCVFLRNARAEGEIRLPGTWIGGDLSCSGMKLTEADTAISADGMVVQGCVFLRNVHTEGEIRLLGGRFGGSLDCSGMVLIKANEALSADGLAVKSCVLLRDIETAGEIRLPGVHINGDLDCEGAKLLEAGVALNCDGANIGGTWFWRAGAKSDGIIDMTGARIGAIDDDPACWPEQILLNRCRYGALVGTGVSGSVRRDWLHRSRQDDSACFWSQPYEECARVLRVAGLNADAREILIDKERQQRRARHHRLGREFTAAGQLSQRVAIGLQRWLLWIWDRIIGLTVAYGRRPYQVLVPMLLLLIFGAITFAEAADRGEIRPNQPGIQRATEWVNCATAPQRQLDCFLAQPEAQSYPQFNALIYSADTLIPAISLEMQSYWIPDDRKPFGRTARVYLWIHIVLGWGLALLAIAGFAGLVRTDSKS